MKSSNYYDAYFRQYGEECFAGKMDWLWFKCQALQESNFNPEALSPAGAIGVMQLMPGTAKEVAQRLGVECLPLVPHLNIRMGISYDRRCWDVWGEESEEERIRFMLGSYNAGVGNIVKAQRLAKQWGLPTDRWESIVKTLPQITGRNAEETITYVERITRYYRQHTEGEA